MEDIEAEKATASRELEWLLSSLHETLDAVKSGFKECMTLLDGPSSTLPLSSPRSESLKGIISRTGTQITRADMQVKMQGLPHTKGMNACKLTLASPTGDQKLVLEQLSDVKEYVEISLEHLNPECNEDILDPNDAISSAQLLHLLRENVLAARKSLKGSSPEGLFPFRAIDSKMFDPPLSPTVAVNLYISDAALVVDIRTLDTQSTHESNKTTFLGPSLIDTLSPPGFREKFTAAVKHRYHGNNSSSVEEWADQIIEYKHKGTMVKVRESVKVVSQDPSLMAVWAKLGGLEHVLNSAIKPLEIVMTAAGVQV